MLDSIKGPELSRQGDIRAPTSADFEAEKQAGRNSCRGSQKHLLLFYLVCPCNVVTSRVTVCFAEECRNSDVSKWNFLTSLGNVWMQGQITPFTVWGFLVKTFEKVKINPFLGGLSYKTVKAESSKSVARSLQIVYQKLCKSWTSSGYSVQICTGFVQVSIGSNTPVIMITSSNTWSSFLRRVSKKHITINYLILTALLPGQSGGCKNVLWQFSREGCKWKEAP